MMNAPLDARSLVAAKPSLLSRLKVPAILLLISVNMLYFGGNAALDIVQTLGPQTRFSGTMTNHEEIVTKGENSQQFLVLTIDTSGGGQLKFDVPEHTFNDTRIGQQVTGTQDRIGLLGHDEGLRTLQADGKLVFHSNARNRLIGQAFILGVVGFVCYATARWVWSRSRRTRGEIASGIEGSAIAGTIPGR